MPDADAPDRPLRVLVTCVPATGHLTPLLPLAEAFARAGDDVLVASGPDVAPAVAAAGLRHRQVGPALGEWFAALAARTPGPPGAGLPPEHVERYFVPRLFGEVGTALVRPELEALVAGWSPDLLVFDQHAVAAPLVAALAGVPAVQHRIGLRSDPLVLDLVADAVAPAWSAAGLPAPPAAGLDLGRTLAIYPPALDPPPPGATVLSLRSTPLPVPAAPRPVDLPDPGRPLVYVTLGTSFNEPAVFRLLLRALADLPVSVLVTMGRDRSPAELGELPGNATVARFLPQASVLPHCAAVVHHGGAGTALGVLAHGLPSVVLPRGADNFAVAARVAAAGTARVVGPGELSAGAVREAVRAVLADPGIRTAAERIAGQIAAMPGPDDVAALLRRAVPAHARSHHRTREAAR